MIEDCFFSIIFLGLSIGWLPRSYHQNCILLYCSNFFSSDPCSEGWYKTGRRVGLDSPKRVCISTWSPPWSRCTSSCSTSSKQRSREQSTTSKSPLDRLSVLDLVHCYVFCWNRCTLRKIASPDYRGRVCCSTDECRCSSRLIRLFVTGGSWNLWDFEFGLCRWCIGSCRKGRSNMN
jgi:hypothetical protein